MLSWKEYRTSDKMISISVSKDRQFSKTVVTKNIYFAPDEERKMIITIESYD